MGPQVQVAVIEPGNDRRAQSLLHFVHCRDQVCELTLPGRVGARDVAGVGMHGGAGIDQERA